MPEKGRCAVKAKSIMEVLEERLALVDALGAVGARVQKPKLPKAFSVAVRDKQLKKITQALWAIGEDPDDDYTEPRIRKAVAALRAAKDSNEWNGAFPVLINELDYMHGGSLVPRFTWAMQNPEAAKQERRDAYALWASDDDDE